MKLNVYLSESNSSFDAVGAYKRAVTAYINKQRIAVLKGSSNVGDKLARDILVAIPHALKTSGSKICVLETPDGFTFRVIVVKDDKFVYDALSNFRVTKSFNDSSAVVYKDVSGDNEVEYFPYVSFKSSNLLKQVTE